jgi:hypothetical protein
MELPMLHDHSRNSTYDAVMAGKYSHIRLMEMGKNKLRDGSGVDGNDHLIVPPPQGDSMADGQLSRWLAPAVGNYSNINCRAQNAAARASGTPRGLRIIRPGTGLLTSSGLATRWLVSQRPA